MADAGQDLQVRDGPRRGGVRPALAHRHHDIGVAVDEQQPDALDRQQRLR